MKCQRCFASAENLLPPPSPLLVKWPIPLIYVARKVEALKMGSSNSAKCRKFRGVNLILLYFYSPLLFVCQSASWKQPIYIYIGFKQNRRKKSSWRTEEGVETVGLDCVLSYSHSVKQSDSSSSTWVYHGREWSIFKPPTTVTHMCIPNSKISWCFLFWTLKSKAVS